MRTFTGQPDILKVVQVQDLLTGFKPPNSKAGISSFTHKLLHNAITRASYHSFFKETSQFLCWFVLLEELRYELAWQHSLEFSPLLSCLTSLAGGHFPDAPQGFRRSLRHLLEVPGRLSAWTDTELANGI
jgi:hypothetical protein